MSAAELPASSLLGGRYRLVERLGAGGMAVVWRGYDEVLGRQVAVKVLAPSSSHDPTFRRRLRVEAQAAARLSHPHITGVYDYGESVTADGDLLPYVVMELVDGESLSSVLARLGALPWPAAVRLCAEVAAALAAAHARGIVHRDVAPANVMLTVGGAKVVDFGISALVGENDMDPDGSLLGTPAYLAPERLEGGQVSPATDVYAVGLLLYRCLTGLLPWDAGTTTALLLAHQHTDPDPLPPIAGMPPEVAEVCGRCLAKQPGERPTTAQLAEILTRAALAAPATPLPLLTSATGPDGETTILPWRIDLAALAAHPTSGAGPVGPVPVGPVPISPAGAPMSPATPAHASSPPGGSAHADPAEPGPTHPAHAGALAAAAAVAPASAVPVGAAAGIPAQRTPLEAGSVPAPVPAAVPAGAAVATPTPGQPTPDRAAALPAPGQPTPAALPAPGRHTPDGAAALPAPRPASDAPVGHPAEPPAAAGAGPAVVGAARTGPPGTPVRRRLRRTALVATVGVAALAGGAYGLHAWDPGSGTADASGPGGPAAAGGNTSTCVVTYAVHADDRRTFRADVTVRNKTAHPVEEWQLRFALPGDQTVTVAEPGVLEQQGRNVAAASPDPIPAGGSVVLALTGSYTQSNLLPSTFVLNESVCEVLLAATPGAQPRPVDDLRAAGGPVGGPENGVGAGSVATGAATSPSVAGPAGNGAPAGPAGNAPGGEPAGGVPVGPGGNPPAGAPGGGVATGPGVPPNTGAPTQPPPGGGPGRDNPGQGVRDKVKEIKESRKAGKVPPVTPVVP